MKKLGMFLGLIAALMIAACGSKPNVDALQAEAEQAQAAVDSISIEVAAAQATLDSINAATFDTEEAKTEAVNAATEQLTFYASSF